MKWDEEVIKCKYCGKYVHEDEVDAEGYCIDCEMYKDLVDDLYYGENDYKTGGSNER